MLLEKRQPKRHKRKSVCMRVSKPLSRAEMKMRRLLGIANASKSNKTFTLIFRENEPFCEASFEAFEQYIKSVRHHHGKGRLEARLCRVPLGPLSKAQGHRALSLLPYKR